jgi:hypothetical protein
MQTRPNRSTNQPNQPQTTNQQTNQPKPPPNPSSPIHPLASFHPQTPHPKKREENTYLPTCNSSCVLAIRYPSRLMRSVSLLSARRRLASSCFACALVASAAFVRSISSRSRISSCVGVGFWGEGNMRLVGCVCCAMYVLQF